MSQTRCVVGFDGGGSKTVCVVSTADGMELGRATGGPSNYQVLGEAATQQVLLATLRDAVSRAVPAGGALEMAACCFGLAGVDRQDDRAAIGRIVARMMAAPVTGVSWRFEPSQATIVNDAVVSLVGGTGRREGVVAVAGTGSIAFGMDAAGQTRRAGGWGHLLGDEGSGYAIGLSGLRAVCRAADGRAPETALTAVVLAAQGLGEPQALIGQAYGGWGVPEIASLAPLVLRVATEGDQVAQSIVDEAASELALAAATVIRELGMAHRRLQVVMGGGLWQGSPRLRERFAKLVQQTAADAQVIAPHYDAVTGAVLLAREAIGAVTLA